MTNEELKNMLFIIDTLLDDAITDSTRQKVKDSLTEVCKLAIKALEAQSKSNEFFNFDSPMVKKSDAVSREAVIRLVEQYPNIIGNRCSGLISDIKHLPPVTPQASEEDIHREREQAYTLGYEDASKKFRTQPCEDCISREEIKEFINTMLTSNEEMGSIATNEGRWVEEKTYLHGVEILEGLSEYVNDLPSVKPKYTDEEIDKAQAVEQAYVDKMVELAVEESRKKWLESFDTSSATKCFEAVNLLKQRLEGEE